MDEGDVKVIMNIKDRYVPEFIYYFGLKDWISCHLELLIAPIIPVIRPKLV